MQNNKNNLISIDDLIFRARTRGVDFGKGDPRERLRYLTKIGLLPHAQRKSFINGSAPNGAYPEYVIELLEEIDKKLKAGKSIQELKKEKERESFFGTEVSRITSLAATEIFHQPPQAQPETEPISAANSFKKFFSVFKILLLFLICGGIIFLSVNHLAKEGFYSYLFASFNRVQKFAQAPLPLPEEAFVAREIFLPAAADPYLTINAETDINAPLNVKEQITAPAFNLFENEFRGSLISAGLTADRTYSFPDLSGIICLSTGNCIFGTEEERRVSSSGAIPNRLTKFLSSDEIGISSIEDFYPGIALTVNSAGQVGIGTREPAYPLHVTGRIQATGDICTNLAGGRCLSTLPIGGGGGGRGGIGGFGTAGYLPIWTDGNTLGDSIIRQTGSIIDVAGRVRMLSFQLSAGASSTYVLTSDADGVGTWQALPPGVLPAGIAGQTLRYNGAGWIADSFLYNTGSAISIGTTSTLATLTLSGNAVFATTTLPQLALRYDDLNYLNFAIDGDQSLIEASKRLVLNSLTGEIRLGGSVNFFDAFGAEVRGATFISTTTDSTVRKSGELVFRASIPIFRYSVPSQTSSTTNTQVSKNFLTTDSLNLITPAQLPGTTRVYAFLINFADNIATTSSSSWRVYRPSAGTEPFTFEFPGQGPISLEIGNSHLTATTTLPDNDWRLDVRVPLADRTIRIFNIFLLVFDQIN